MPVGAVFVDAGYLYAGACHALFGRAYPRDQLVFRYPSVFLDHLAKIAADACGAEDLRILRTYWYDGARDGMPSEAQIRLGELPKVKLRLGRLGGKGQKGVDGLIILDLISLALNDAIDTAIILSGDEDLREAMVFAQGHGVSAILVGVPDRPERNGQSGLLIRDADHHLVLSAEVLAPHLERRVTPAPVPLADASPAAAGAVEDGVRALAEAVVFDARFVEREQILDLRRPGHLTKSADRLLVSRVAERIGSFPVDEALLRSARAACLVLAVRRWPVGELAGATP